MQFPPSRCSASNSLARFRLKSIILFQIAVTRGGHPVLDTRQRNSSSTHTMATTSQQWHVHKGKGGPVLVQYALSNQQQLELWVNPPGIAEGLFNRLRVTPPAHLQHPPCCRPLFFPTPARPLLPTPAAFASYSWLHRQRGVQRWGIPQARGDTQTRCAWLVVSLSPVAAGVLLAGRQAVLCWKTATSTPLHSQTFCCPRCALPSCHVCER